MWGFGRRRGGGRRAIRARRGRCRVCRRGEGFFVVGAGLDSEEKVGVSGLLLLVWGKGEPGEGEVCGR